MSTTDLKFAGRKSSEFRLKKKKKKIGSKSFVKLWDMLSSCVHMLLCDGEVAAVSRKRFFTPRTVALGHSSSLPIGYQRTRLIPVGLLRPIVIGPEGGAGVQLSCDWTQLAVGITQPRPQ